VFSGTECAVDFVKCAVDSCLVYIVDFCLVQLKVYHVLGPQEEARGSWKAFVVD
jgi:hypothetical protein